MGALGLGLGLGLGLPVLLVAAGFYMLYPRYFASGDDAKAAKLNDEEAVLADTTSSSATPQIMGDMKLVPVVYDGDEERKDGALAVSEDDVIVDSAYSEV